VAYSPNSEGTNLLPTDEFDLELPCAASVLSAAREEVSRLLQGRNITIEQRDDIYLALGEALANAIRHGCPAAPAGSRIRLYAACDDERIVMKVTDPGPGFDPSTIPVPDVTELKDGGMGLFFMRNVMDSVEFNQNEQGNTVIMVKRFAAGKQPHSPEAKSSVPL
jgi:serine/threonine-protein kinase RsbW